MKKIGICGAFGFDTNDNGGQPVKTREIYYLFRELYGKENLEILETFGKKKYLNLLIKSFLLVKNCESILMLPANNGLKIFAPLFSFLNVVFKKKLYYSVIGGWLPEFIENKKYLIKSLKTFNGIWVETSTMKDKLEKLGLDNIFVVPNFKDLEILSEEELIVTKNPPYKLCTFSRVMKEKGIEDAIKAVTEINEKSGKIKFELDIYGKIDSGYEEAFSNLQKSFPSYIKYCGMVEPEKSVSVIKDYFALLFPTYYSGEGMPGTVIDAYSSGVPVIATNWRYNPEIITHEVCGLLYDYNSKDLLIDILSDVYKNPDLINNMKKNCIKEAQKYTKKNVMALLEEYMRY